MPAIPPPTSALNWYERRAAIQKAVVQRVQVAGQLIRAPECVRPWDEGTVPGNLTETTFTDASKTLWDPTKINPWAAVDPDPDTDGWQTPGSWRLVIEYDPCDYTSVVFADISGIAAGGGLTFSNLRNYATAKVIPSVAALIGKKYYIIRAGGLPQFPWWSEQLLEWPNPKQYARGFVAAVGNTNTTLAVDVPPSPRFRAIELIGKDLLVYATDGFLKRVTVTAADRTATPNPTISFAAQSWTPAAASAFVVVDPNARAYPDRPAVPSDLHYRGYRTGHPSHDVDDVIRDILLPEQYLHLPGADTLGGCTGQDVLAYARHVYVGQLSIDDLLCGGATADKVYTPHVFKTRTGLQAALLRAARAHVENKSYVGGEAIPLLGEARALQKAGINAYTSTTTTVAGFPTSNTINFGSVAFPRTPIEVYWAVKQPDGEYKFGSGLANSNTQLTAYSETGIDVFQATDTDGSHDEGQEIIISLGFTCPAPRQFKYRQAKTVWIPDTGAGGGPIDPPATDYATTGCQGTGRWVTRPASTTYIDPRYPQTVTPSAKGEVKDGDETFTNGDLAREVGDNFQDGSVRDTAGGAIASDNPLVQYYDHLYHGWHARAVRNPILDSLKGTATGGSKTQLRDTSKNWWARWYGGGLLKTLTGTATGGSTLGFSDTTQASGEAFCWWSNDTFPDFPAHVGFVAEILESGTDFENPNAVIEKRLITASDNTIVSVTWGVATNVSASGKQWRIRWPRYELNWLKGTTVTIRKPDPANPGTTLVEEVAIIGHDDDTLFFAAIPWDVDETTTYRINWKPPGGVYRRTGGAWVPAAGGDAIRYGVTVPDDFLPNIYNNLEDHTKRYGLSCARDTVCRLLDDEMIAVVGVLKKTRMPFVWTADGTTENERTASAGNIEGYSGNWAALQSDTQTAFAAAGGAGVNAAPYALAEGHISLIPSPDTGKASHVGRRRAKGQLTVFVPTCPIPSKIEWYAKAGIDSLDSPPFAGCIDDDHGGGDIRHQWLSRAFDANGDAVAYHAYTRFDVESSYSSVAVRKSDWLGPSNADWPKATTPIEPSPGACFTPTTDGGVTGDYQEDTNTGYYVIQAWAVIDWQYADTV